MALRVLFVAVSLVDIYAAKSPQRHLLPDIETN